MLKVLLYPFAQIYKLIVAVRHKLFDWDILHSEEFDIPIVCVGNITVGGTGKTPISEFLISYLSDNHRVALLSRGYKRRTKGYVEAEVNSSFLSVGDEPKQIKLKFPDIVVAVCEKRVDGIREIRKRHPEVNLIILDDGFQHRYVEPWVNIVLMDYTRPIYRDEFLPVGTLRDFKGQLRRANFIVVTKCPQDINPLEMRIVNSNLGLFPYQSLHFTIFKEGRIAPLFPDMAAGTVPYSCPVIAMAGIGNPDPFVNSLAGRYNIVNTLIFSDHHPYRMRDLAKMKKLLDQSPANTIIVTTEKDAVKLTNRKRIPEQIQRALYFIPIEVSFANDSQEEFLRKLNMYVKSNQKYSLLHS